jgi:hypothetical protein
MPMFNFLSEKRVSAASRSNLQGINAMEEAISRLSIDCDPADASRALYLISAPVSEMNMYIVNEIGAHLRNIAPRATIRNGDYPREKHIIDVNVVFSGLNNVQKIRDYYTKSLSLIPEFQKRQEERQARLKDMEDLGRVFRLCCPNRS